MRVRVHSGPRADGRWRWRADLAAVDYKRETIWTGWGTRDEAEAEILRVLAQGGRATEAGLVTALSTVKDLVETWRADVEPHDRSTFTTIARAGCVGRLVDTLGTTSLDALAGAGGRGVLDAWVRSAPFAPSTLRQDLRTLRSAWLWARDRDLLTVERDLPRVRVRGTSTVRNRRTPTSAEADVVLEALRVTSPWAWRVVYLLAWTGCRPGEIGSLTWDRVVVPTEGAAHVDVTGKTGPRTIPLPRRVADEVRSWPRTTEYVHGVRPVTIRGSLHRRLTAACDFAEVPRWPPYGLRRALVDRLYAHEDPAVAAAILGHGAETALRIYRTVRADETAAAMERVAETPSPRSRTKRTPRK